MATVSAPDLRWIARASAIVAAAFVLTIAGVLLHQHATARTHDPWRSPQLLELKARLRATPADQALKEQIRALDLRFRRDYRRRLALAASGAWLLLAGALVLVVSLQTAARAAQPAPHPRLDREAGVRLARLASWSRASVAIAGGMCVVAMVATAFAIRSRLDLAPAAAAATAAPEPLPSADDYARNWPRFLGPTGSGFAPGRDAPLQWNGASGAGVAWKSAVPVAGFNSPIVWGERVFVSGADDGSREIFCFDAGTGRLVWRRPVEPPRRPAGKGPKVNEMTGASASTMATDGRRVYAIFAHGDVVAVSFDGTVAWTRDLGVPDNSYGHASSLATWQGRVIVQLDQDGKGRSRLFALEGASGRSAWEKPRDVGTSWATPLVIEAAGRSQIITLAEPRAIAYSAVDGAELWHAEVAHGEIVPSPILAGGLIVAVHPSAEFSAIRPDGSGDVTATHVAWRAEDNVPDVTTPASDGELIVSVDSGGGVTCFDAKSGQKVWEHALKLEVQASPLIVGQRVYVSCVNGTTVVLEAGRVHRELARNELGEKIYASPAAVGGRLYVRGVDHLFCLTPAETRP